MPLKVSLAFADNSMPRTIFYDRFCDALRRNPRFVSNTSQPDLLFPLEDITLETNWPRFGDQKSAFVRGAYEESRYVGYIQRLAQQSENICLVSMVPTVRLPLLFRERENFFIADGNLADVERRANSRAISMPAMPATVADTSPLEKTILASFRGAASHPCRLELAKLHNGGSIICELTDPSRYIGRIDATAGVFDIEYVELLRRSIFAFVPRGDLMFSYRLLEVMSFGCIPIVISDGWVLPFDRIVDWSKCSLAVHESEIAMIPYRLRASSSRANEMRAAVGEVYQKHFVNLDAIAESLLLEIESIAGA